jgi:hypothetical protein
MHQTDAPKRMPTLYYLHIIFLMTQVEEFTIQCKLPNNTTIEIDVHSEMTGAQVSFILSFFFYSM